MQINRDEIIWAAGFFDGEGCAGAYKNRRSMIPMISVSQVDREVLDRFQAAVGGLGKVRGPYINGQATKLFQFRTTKCEAVKAIVEMLIPFLSTIKRTQCQTMLEKYEDYYSTFTDKRFK